jgi:hypothetical protein
VNLPRTDRKKSFSELRCEKNAFLGGDLRYILNLAAHGGDIFSVGTS